MSIKIISAGAGSGKTYRLTNEMVALLQDGVRASGIIATTFTKKAAAELQERVRVKLLEEGMSREADELTNALIGTVHGLGVKLLRRFAFEAGVSPQVDIVADEDQQLMFNQALATVLTHERIRIMEHLSNSLGLNKKEYYDWRREVKVLTDVARANDFSLEVLEKSKIQSFESFKPFLGALSGKTEETLNRELLEHLDTALLRLEQNEDSTKRTQDAVNVLKGFRNQLNNRGWLQWHQWAKIAKIVVGAKSQDDVAELIDCAWAHDTHPAFQHDIQQFINCLFDIAIAALTEYENYKKRRGLIDYIDMEIQVKRLLDHPRVQAVLREELDLLMVDEFQDTSPIQLEIFLKLSRMASHSVWVGDPKQSIYGFRGADPRLMKAIIGKVGGVQPENIQTHSWRSREDIVYATNALFCKAFDQLPQDQVALLPKRLKCATEESVNKVDEPDNMGDALIHFHFKYEKEKGQRGKGDKKWWANCIAEAVKELLEQETFILPKDEKECRPARPGDVAVLCRSNGECQIIAEALHRTGLKVAISRSGLLNTAEAKMILACLKYILNETDSLSVAEILLLAEQRNIELIIEDRLSFLAEAGERFHEYHWAKDSAIIQELGRIREETTELSSTEILNLVLAELDLRRIIASWGNLSQRMDNVDVLRKLALEYESGCNRLHIAASLGGFLLWLNELERNGQDMQGSGQSIDSVQVLTYHKSKGLEWPIVFCHSLEATLRDKVWGANMMLDTEQVDIDDVLANRWIRYWVNPYADQSRNTALQERIDQSEYKQTAQDQALEEEARLLYVGITRARDYLVIPTRERASAWINRVWHQGKSDLPTLDEHTTESPWEWNGQFLQKRTEVRSFPKEFPASDLPAQDISYFRPFGGKQSHLPYLIDLREEDFSGEIKSSIKKTMSYSSPVEAGEGTDLYQLAKMLKAFLIADHLDYPFQERMTLADDLLRRFELEEQLKAPHLIRQSESFFNYVDRQLIGSSPAATTGSFLKRVYRKYPLQLLRDGRKFETIVDCLFDTKSGLILIQNSGFAGESKQWKNKATELTSWMHFSKLALQSIFKQKNVRTFVHFVMGASLMEIVSKAQQPSQSDQISLFSEQK